MIKEGYIKFRCLRTEADIQIHSSVFDELNNFREILFQKQWIGCLENGIGYGNISIRDHSGNGLFFISGSATGGIKKLEAGHYSQVFEVDLLHNFLKCIGRIDASSESMSHAAIYKSNPDIQSVIHIHNTQMWKSLLNNIPTTPANAEYGTPELALAIQKMVLQNGQPFGIIALEGHEDGIIAYGRNCKEAYQMLLNS